MTLRELLAEATPGRWEYDLVNGYVGPTYPRNDRREFRYIVADVDTTGEAVALDQGHANARLIALTPTLASLLLDMADELRGYLDFYPEDEDCGDPACDECAGPRRIRALLARLDRIDGRS